MKSEEMKHKEYRAEWKKKRIDAGLCTYCGKPNNTPTYKTCQICRDIASRRFRERNNNLKSLSLCIQCSKSANGWYCVEHAVVVATRHTYRRNNDIQFRLASVLRTRLWHAIKNKAKSGSAIRDLGCTILELMAHLEQLFTLDMSWDNYGEWEIDHIKPLSSFDLTDREQLLIACHFTNLQPLWRIDNLRKSGKIK